MCVCVCVYVYPNPKIHLLYNNCEYRENLEARNKSQIERYQ